MHIHFGLAEVIFQGFQCNFLADPFPEFETVRYRLFTAVDSYFHAVQYMDIDPGLMQGVGDPEDFERRIFDARPDNILWKRDVDAVGDLGGQLVKIQGRDETDDTFRHKQADLDKVQVAREFGIREPVDPARFANQFAALNHLINGMFRDSKFNRPGGTQDTTVFPEYFFICFDHGDIIQGNQCIFNTNTLISFLARQANHVASARADFRDFKNLGSLFTQR